MTSPQLPRLATALRHPRYLVSEWPWRALGYLVSTAPIAGVLSVGLLLLGAPLLAAVNAVRQHGRPIPLLLALFLALGTLTLVGFAPIVSAAAAAVERWRLELIDPRPLPARRWSGVAQRYTSAGAWREREVLALIAEGRSNAAIAAALHVTEAAVGKHVGNILTKLGPLPSDDTNRRVLAVLTYLRGGPAADPGGATWTGPATDLP